MPKTTTRTKAVRTIPYNFGKKHLLYMKRCADSMINVAEGAVRAGKTVDNIFAFCEALRRSRDKLHLASASTVPTAKLVLGDCNGFGIEHFFRGQCRWGKFKGNDALIICGKYTGYQEKIIIFVGGAKADSYKKFRGFSIGMWIATEINLHHSDTIKEAFNRQLAAQDRKVFWDLNPSAPEHFIYTEYIDIYAKRSKDGDLGFSYNYEKFTIFDNINIPEENKRQIISQYSEGSIWYRRDILGDRCTAEGLIFTLFAENTDEFIAENYPRSLRMINIGVDFGGNKSKTVFVASGIIGNFSSLAVLADHKIEGGKGTIDTDLICRELARFVRFLRDMFPGAPIGAVFCDCAEQTIINSIRIYFAKNGIKIPVKDSFKGSVNERIYALNALMSQRRFTVHRDCRNVINSLRTQVWDDKHITEDVRLDDGTKDIDTADALEYSFSSYINMFNIRG